MGAGGFQGDGESKASGAGRCLCGVSEALRLPGS